MALGQQATATSEPAGSFKAAVKYSKLLFTRAMLMPSIRRGLTGRMPQGRSLADGQVTSSPGMPVLQSFDMLKTGEGDQITIDMKGRAKGKPVMGDRTTEGTSTSLEYARDNVYLNLATKVFNPGGLMNRQRNLHDTRMDMLDAGARWVADYEDNLTHVHLAGARGSQTGQHWIVPLESDADFEEICVNTVLPPTRNRYKVPGSATGMDDLATTNVISLDFLADCRTIINTSEVPLQPVSSRELQGKVGYENSNSQLLVGLITEEQFNTVRKAAGDGTFTKLVSEANSRMDFKSHPVFSELDCFLWRGVLYFKTPRAIEFAAGSDVKQYNATTGALETVQANVRAHRGIILGAQALASVYGNIVPWTLKNQGGASMKKNTPVIGGSYMVTEEIKEGGGKLDAYFRMMAGFKKLRYTIDGQTWDNGVFVFDTYQAPLQ